MTAKKQQAPQTEAPQLWRLAEVIQMRRITTHSANGWTWWFECQLCLGKSDAGGGEIQHKADCPIERMK